MNSEFSELISSNNYKQYRFCLLLILLAVPLFYRLDHLTIRLWDESRLVGNTLEMYRNNNYLVTYFDGTPDMWNTKPPLMIWIHLFFVKLFGFNEWAFRISSACFGLATAWYIFRFTLHNTKKFYLAAIAAIVLITTRGYIDDHITRTGDYDALLIFLGVLGLGSFFNYTSTQHPKYLYFSSSFFGLAVLAKGPTIALFAPGILVYLLLTKKLLVVLKNKHTYWALLVFFSIALPYYFLRERYNPGYLRAVYENELGGRFFTVLEYQGGAWYYYLQNMIGRNFNIWFIFLPVGIYLWTKEKNQSIKRFILFCIITGICYFTMISISKTKHGWYDAPAYPFFAIIVAYAILKVSQLVKESQLSQKLKYSIYILFVLLFSTAYALIFIENILPEDKTTDKDDYDIAYYIRSHIDHQITSDTIYILQTGYHPTSYLYFEQLKQRGIPIVMTTLEAIPYHATIWAPQDSLFQQLKQIPSLQFTIIDSFRGLRILKAFPSIKQ